LRERAREEGKKKEKRNAIERGKDMRQLNDQGKGRKRARDQMWKRDQRGVTEGKRGIERETKRARDQMWERDQRG
jgi:hypothetical protein